MKHSEQDKIYLDSEGDNFFQRNHANKDHSKLRDQKKTILSSLDAAEITPVNILEFGCNFADLLYHFKKEDDKRVCVGVDASSAALRQGASLCGDGVTLVKGTIADNKISEDQFYAGFFDLVIVEDVFAWVSRETLIQSLANIDNVLKDGGHLFIRDFYPKEFTKNANHHVKEGTVFNFKIPGSHARIFESTGIYQIANQRTYMHSSLGANYPSNREFENRWSDTILRKSLRNYFLEQ